MTPCMSCMRLSSLRMLQSAAGKAEIDGQTIFGNRPEVVFGVFHVEGMGAVVPHGLFICEGIDPAVAIAGVGGDRLAGGHPADTRNGREALSSRLKNVLQLRQGVGGYEEFDHVRHWLKRPKKRKNLGPAAGAAQKLEAFCEQRGGRLWGIDMLHRGRAGLGQTVPLVR